METAGSIVRSRIKWAEYGERSSKYFCNLEKRSYEKKNIRQLKTDSGQIVVDSKKVLHEIFTLIFVLYSSEVSQEDMEFVNEFVVPLDIPVLAEESVLNLNRPITKNELWNALKTMGLEKSPGFDGLPCEFYLTFFNDIIDVLLDSFNYSFQKGILSNSQRCGIITLLPKKDKDPMLVKNYRPISLLNVDYKLLAKVMSSRLKPCMDSLIHLDQQGFMKGRIIGTNIRTIIDLIEYTDLTNDPGSIVLLDFEKAFDRIEHKYLFKALEYFNLGDNFIRWIKTFYKDRNSRILNNGFISDPVSIDRGIFQGCPISPLLFLLAIEILAISIRSNPFIKGIPIGPLDKKISLFADDTICFLNGESDSFKHLFDTLAHFAKFSGCRINLNKSEAVHIGKLKGSDFIPIDGQGLTWGKNTFKALGVVFSLNTKALYELNFVPKLGIIEQILNCWKHRS